MLSDHLMTVFHGNLEKASQIRQRLAQVIRMRTVFSLKVFIYFFLQFPFPQLFFFLMQMYKCTSSPMAPRARAHAHTLTTFSCIFLTTCLPSVEHQGCEGRMASSCLGTLRRDCQPLAHPHYPSAFQKLQGIKGIFIVHFKHRR